MAQSSSIPLALAALLIASSLLIYPNTVTAESSELRLYTDASVYNNQPTEIPVFGQTESSLLPIGTDNEQDIVAVTDLRVTDIHGLAITECSDCLSSMLMLNTKIKNNLDTAESFVAYLEVRDMTGYTIFNEFAIGTINPDESIDVAMSWMPEKAGHYEIRSFVVEKLQNAEWMSPVKSIRMVVTS